MSTRSKDWELKDIKAKAPGDAKIHLRSTDDMLNWLDAFFPNSESQLCIIPHPSRIKRKNLFVQEKHKEDKTFDSEVVDVFGCLIESLPSGFAFYEYKTQQAKNTFSNVNPFEIDWILVNKSGICVVEVGEASDPKNPGSIINDKINQIRNKSRDVIEQVLKAASKGQFSDNVKYIVALPNVKTQQIRIWLSDKTSIALDRLWFFTVETLTTNEIYSGSKLEVAENLESFFRFGGEFDQALKLVASLICHGYHATCKRRTGGDNLLDAVENKLQLSKKDKERRDKQLGQIWNQLHFPEDLILSPQQLDAFKAIVSVVAASYYMAYSNSVEKVLKGEMRKSMRLYRGENSSWADSVAWNLLQLHHDCCGVNNKSDWIGTPWHIGNPSVNAYIQQYPFTCCKMSNEPSIKSIRKGNIEPSTSDVDNCYEGANPTGLRRQGCYKALRKVLSDYGVIIGLCLFGLLSLQILLVYLSCQIATKHKSGNAFWFSQKLPEDQD